LFEHANFAVQNQRRGFERGDRARELAKARCVVDVVAADEADGATVLELARPFLSLQNAMIRQPSYFFSYTQPGRWNGLSSVGAIGLTVTDSEDIYA